MPVGLETYLQPALQPVFDRVFVLAGYLISKLINVGLKETLTQWEKMLRMIEAVLNDAEQKQFQEKAIKTWLDVLQDLALDMEDVLEYYANEVRETESKKMDQENVNSLDQENVNSLSSALRFLRSSADNVVTLFNPVICPDIQSQIDEITKRLQDVQSRSQFLGLSAAQVMQLHTIHGIQTEAHRDLRESTCIKDEKIYGRDDEKQEIIAQLLNVGQSNGENYAVVPIVGKGGVGKTTLAQYVYNDEQLNDYFDVRAWVCVSDVFDVKRITTAIFNEATTGQSVSDFSNLNDAQKRLKQQLTGKKFMIVLDDIWDNNYDNWDKLQKPFRGAAKGSKVIMTTRIEEIANMMIDKSVKNSTIIKLKVLSDDYTWCLFQQHVEEVDSDLAEMRDDIIEKCKGLPLVAKVLGGLLKRKPKEFHKMILQSKTWYEDSIHSDVLPVLKLSYDHLTPPLRHMFAYCSMFPKDYTFQEMEVVLLWMAQGFLPDDQPEDKGRYYFSELVSRSLFEVSQFSEEGFIMHDFIHDLAAWAARGLYYAIDTMDILPDLKRTRHVFLTSNAIRLRDQLPLTSKLRTFYCGRITLNFTNLDFLQRFRYIRTLQLNLHFMEVLPEFLGNLKHLRFLSLRWGSMKEFPESMGSLWNLQTLWLEYFRELQKLPSIRNLGKLRHLNIGEGSNLEEMPMGIGELTDLQSLDRFVLGDGRGERIRDLKNLNHLHGRLTILGLRNVLSVEDAKEAQLDKKDGLNELRLEWSGRRRYVADDILEQSAEDGLDELSPEWSGRRDAADDISEQSEEDGLDELSDDISEQSEEDGLDELSPEWSGTRDAADDISEQSEEDGLDELSPEWSGRRDAADDISEQSEEDGLVELSPEWINRRDAADEEDVVEQLKPHNSIKQLVLHGYMGSRFPTWLGNPCFSKMVDIRLYSCARCDCLPELGQLPSLKNLSIEGMDGIKVIDADLRCQNPPFPVLKSLKFKSMKSWEKWVHSPPAHDRAFPCLEELSIAHCPSLEGELPTHLPSLRKLSIKDCPSMQGVQPLHLPCLRLLLIKNCKKLSFSLQSLPFLEVLESERCDLILIDVGADERLNIRCELAYLTTLKIEKCKSLISLAGLLLPALQHLRLNDCENVESLPSELHRYTSLRELKIERCPKIQEIPEGGLPINLEHLTIEEVNIKHCVQELETISSSILTLLWVFKCPKLESLVGNFTWLSDLRICNCPNFEFFAADCLPRNLTLLILHGRMNRDKPIREWGLHLLSSLKYLELEDLGRSTTEAVECIPSPNLLLPSSSLSRLIINGFQDLKSIDCSSFPNLITLWIKNCPKFESFGDHGLPPKLQRMKIEECESLKPLLKIDPHGPIRIGECKYSLQGREEGLSTTST